MAVTVTLADINNAGTLARLAKATKRNMGSRKGGILRAMHTIDPRCTLCETVTSYNGAKGDMPEMGHLIPAAMITPGAAGEWRGGFTADNVVIMCQECNAAMGDTIVSVLAFLPSYFGTFPRPVTTGQGAGCTGKRAARVALGYGA